MKKNALSRRGLKVLEGIIFLDFWHGGSPASLLVSPIGALVLLWIFSSYFLWVDMLLCLNSCSICLWTTGFFYVWVVVVYFLLYVHILSLIQSITFFLNKKIYQNYIYMFWLITQLYIKELCIGLLIRTANVNKLIPCLLSTYCYRLWYLQILIQVCFLMWRF